MYLYAHFCTSRSGSNCLYYGIINTMSKQFSIPITNVTRFNRFRNDIIYKNIYFSKIRLFQEIKVLELGTPKKAICSFRKNRLQQAISNYLSTEGITTSMENIVSKKESDDIQNSLEIDEKNFCQGIDKLINIKIPKKENKLLSYFQENNIEYKIIYYEDLINNYVDTVKECIKFLFNVNITVPIKMYTYKSSCEINKYLYEVYTKKGKLYRFLGQRDAINK